MKKMKLRLAVICLAIIVISTFINATTQQRNSKNGTLYYWYWTDDVYYGHYHTAEYEGWETGTDTSPAAPSVLYLKGFVAGNVYFVGGTPVPIDPYSPDEELYYHP